MSRKKQRHRSQFLHSLFGTRLPEGKEKLSLRHLFTFYVSASRLAETRAKTWAWLNLDIQKGGPTSLWVVWHPTVNFRTPSISTNSIRKKSLRKHFPAWISSAHCYRLYRGGAGEEVGEAVPFEAYKPLGHLGCNVRGSLFSVPMTLGRST